LDSDLRPHAEPLLQDRRRARSLKRDQHDVPSLQVVPGGARVLVAVHALGEGVHERHELDVDRHRRARVDSIQGSAGFIYGITVTVPIRSHATMMKDSEHGKPILAVCDNKYLHTYCDTISDGLLENVDAG
jgi:hypothetical protein